MQGCPLYPDLHGKAAIVTGGSTGIGRAIVEALAQNGVAVTFSGLTEGGGGCPAGVAQTRIRRPVLAR